jgi:hypothetical protein
MCRFIIVKGKLERLDTLVKEALFSPGVTSIRAFA